MSDKEMRDEYNVQHNEWPGLDWFTWQIAWHAARGAVPAQPEWISAKDRMPPEETHVLAAVQFDHPNDWRIKVGGIHEGRWQIFGGSWTPSHWMPLPAAPAARKEGGD